MFGRSHRYNYSFSNWIKRVAGCNLDQFPTYLASKLKKMPHRWLVDLNVSLPESTLNRSFDSSHCRSHPIANETRDGISLNGDILHSFLLLLVRNGYESFLHCTTYPNREEWGMPPTRHQWERRELDDGLWDQRDETNWREEELSLIEGGE